jgi:hypothetical protein
MVLRQLWATGKCLIRLEVVGMDSFDLVEQTRLVKMDLHRREGYRSITKGDNLGTTVVRITDPIMPVASLLAADSTTTTAVDMHFVAAIDYTTAE